MQTNSTQNNGVAVQQPQQLTMQMLNSTSPLAIAELPQLEQRFVGMLARTQGISIQEAEMVFHQEKYNFLKVVRENATLRECEGLSLYGCFMDCAVNGLSFDPTKKLAYLIPNNVNIGTKDNPQWVKRATLVISPYGDLAIRQRMRQIKYADNPIIVYKDDVFKPYVGEDGEKRVHYELNLNHTKEIIGCFIRITRIDGTKDVHWMLQEDIARLKGYSAKKNNNSGNALYTSQNGGIDPGFLGAKLIKHAFKSYPKVKIAGNFAVEEKDNEIDDIYGLAPGVEIPNAQTQLPQPSMIVNPIPHNPAAMNGVSDTAKAAMLNATAEEPADAQPTVQFPQTEDDGSF